MGNTYKSMQGRQVDMEKLMRQNELMPAIGNVRVNARGDELGPGGTIIKKHEDIVAEYYENNTNASAENIIKPVQTKVQSNSPVRENTVAKKGKSTNES